MTPTFIKMSSVLFETERYVSRATLSFQHVTGYITILADEGYIGFTDSQILQFMTPYKKPRNGVLSQAKLAANKKLDSPRIIIENYFRRLSNRFLIVVGG
jgi:hypothetical protein